MTSTMPPGSILLHGPAEEVGEVKPGTSSAILLKFGEDVLRDLKSASKDELRFVTGNTPKLRIGGRTIDLNISRDDFRNELYASTTGASTTDFTFTSLVSHRAELKSAKQYGGETAGTDAALAALQNSLRSYEQEKEANQTTIANKVLEVPKNRWDAARKEKLDRKRRLLDSRQGSQPPSPSLSAVGTPRLGAAPTSAPLSEDELKLKAMRMPLVHLLAIGPTTKEEMKSKTHIPKDDLDLILQKVGKEVDGKWKLADRSYKELDVWSFGYPSKEDRDASIDNAIRAYDRLRLGTDDKLWQLLLPKEERGKGKILSRLHLNNQVGAAAKSLTPHYQPSPAPHVNSGEEQPTSSANTPRLGSSTPRPTSSKGDVMKRLLSKNPQKAHKVEEAKMKKTKAAEEAREKKRKEKEEMASDKEGGRPAKRQTTKKTNPKVKSADIVHSSDDESGEDGEVKERPSSAPKAPTPAKKKAAAPSTSTESSSDSAKPIKEVKKTVASTKANQSAAKSTSSPAVKATKPAARATGTGKNTPQPTNGLSAPSSQPKARSPSAVSSRPGVPSPLGAARPRNASDVSDRSAVGVQRVRQGAETPKGLGITNGVRKRNDTVISKENGTPNGSEAKPKERTSADKAQKSSVNGTNTPKTNGAAAKPAAAGIKRKASDSDNPPSQSQSEPNVKHRKTASNSSLSLSATNTSTASNNSNASNALTTTHTAQTSPDSSSASDRDHHKHSHSHSSTDSALLDTISYKTGVNQAEKFTEQFYPAYTALYDEIEAAQRRGERVAEGKMKQFWKMHARLQEMKREIEAASRREGGGD